MTSMIFCTHRNYKIIALAAFEDMAICQDCGKTIGYRCGVLS